jgi:glutaredoxin
MKTLLTCLLLVVSLTLTLAESVPTQWLQGQKGYEKALELQKTSKVPILVWATWTTCPYCKEVTGYLQKPKPKKALKDYIRVMVDEKGAAKEAAFCKEKSFHGGTFYVIGPDSPKPVTWQWAWKGKTRNIVDNIEDDLAKKLAEAGGSASK